MGCERLAILDGLLSEVEVEVYARYNQDRCGNNHHNNDRIVVNRFAYLVHRYPAFRLLIPTLSVWVIISCSIIPDSATRILFGNGLTQKKICLISIY